LGRKICKPFSNIVLPVFHYGGDDVSLSSTVTSGSKLRRKPRTPIGLQKPSIGMMSLPRETEFRWEERVKDKTPQPAIRSVRFDDGGDKGETRVISKEGDREIEERE
jgi:hypothetical protein